MPNLRDLLIEIGTEELPPNNLQALVAAFAKALSAELTTADFAHQNIEEFATPRRLAVIIHAVEDMQSERIIERRGPLLSKAYDQDKKPTALALGFAKACGVDIKQLSVTPSEKGECLFFSRTEPGQALAILLPTLITSALSALPIVKPMRWGNYTTEFARPIHWIVILHGEEVISANIFAIQSSNVTFGHRFHHPEAIILKNTNEYADKLAMPGRVIADFAKRRQLIREKITDVSKNKGNAIIEDDMLNEVTAMVELPVALLGNFSVDFLNLPSEVLISVMKIHQKCFHIKNTQGDLLPNFVMISKIESKNTSRVIADNECVMRARLNDAEFFYHSDKQHTLTEQSKKLEHVLFQNKLGSMLDKAKRIENLTGVLANKIGVDITLAKRAGLLAKADLVTDMVGEFPELNGTMGYYYAKHDGEPELLAMAIKEHYFPRFAGDQLPQTDLGCLISIADRLDTLVGLFAIKQIPTGDKDPFALRRAALGLLRIIIEKEYMFDLRELIAIAISDDYAIPFENSDITQQTLDFIFERLRAWYTEQNIRPDVFAAVHACHPSQPLDFHRRIQAVNAFVQSPAAKALAAANKRVSNILKKQTDIARGSNTLPDANLLTETVEKELAAMLNKKIQEVTPLYQAGKYTEGLIALVSLQQPIDNFFNDVMVMVDDKKVRDNRLALLKQLYELFSQVADISLLQE